MNIHVWGPLTVAFLLGIVWRLFSRASKAYRSNLRSYPSRLAFVRTNWDVFLLRTFPFNSGLFVLWLFHPDWLSKGLIFAHVPASFANWIIVTPNLMTSFAGGFVIDYALDQIQLKLATVPLPSWVPDAIRGEIPSYDPGVINGSAFVQANNRDAGLNNGKSLATNSPIGGD